MTISQLLACLTSDSSHALETIRIQANPSCLLLLDLSFYLSHHQCAFFRTSNRTWKRDGPNWLGKRILHKSRLCWKCGTNSSRFQLIHPSCVWYSQMSLCTHKRLAFHFSQLDALSSFRPRCRKCAYSSESDLHLAQTPLTCCSAHTPQFSRPSSALSDGSQVVRLSFCQDLSVRRGLSVSRCGFSILWPYGWVCTEFGILCSWLTRWRCSARTGRQE